MSPRTRLTQTQIKAAQPKTKPYKLSVGSGLYLAIMPNGGKYWRLRYRWARREKIFSIGIYPNVSFADALAARDHARDQLRQGIDPSQAKQEAAKLKAQSPQSIFRMKMTRSGELIIETDTKLIKLTSYQTMTLKEFLNSDDRD